MKTMKRYMGLYYGLLALLMVATVIIYSFNPRVLLSIAGVNGIALMVALLWVLLPRGATPLATTDNPSEKLPMAQWLSKIIGLQMILWLLYFAISQFNHYFAVEGQVPETVVNDSLQTLGLHFGMYPWGLIALFAVGFGLTAYRQQRHAYLDDLLLPARYRLTQLRVIIKTLARACTLGGLAISLVMLTFIILSTANSTTHLKALTGFSGAAMGLSFLMLFLTMRRDKNPFFVTMNRERPLLGMLITLLIWIIVLSLASVIVQYTGTGDNQPPALIDNMLAKGWLLHWQLFSVYWWLLFVPITGVMIARFSYGYSVRAVILATLALPLVLTLFLQAIKSGVINTNMDHAPLWLVQVTGIWGGLALLGLIYQKPQRSLVTLTYLPTMGHDKSRSEEIYQERLKKMCGLIFYLFIPAGFFATSLLMGLLFIPMLFVLLGICVRLILSFGVSLETTDPSP